MTIHQSLHLATRAPLTTEKAQYSTGFPTALAAVGGGIGARNILEGAPDDPEILRLATIIEITESDSCNAAFPARRIAHAVLHRIDRRILRADPTEARDDPKAMVPPTEMREKYHALADPVPGQARSTKLRALAEAMADDGRDANALIELATESLQR